MPGLSRARELLSAVLVFGAWAAVSCAQPSTFTGLTSPFGPASSVGTIGGVSGDGAVVVGSAAMDKAGRYPAFRWRRGAGFDEPVSTGDGAMSVATGVSADGCVIAGYTASPELTRSWIAGGAGAVQLDSRTIWAMAPDGSVCVGWFEAGAVNQAGWLSEGGAWREIAGLGAGGVSRALGVSDRGAVIVGELAVAGGLPSAAFVRRAGGVDRIVPRTGQLAPSTVCVSASGEVVAGSSIEGMDDVLEGRVHDRTAWVWTRSGGTAEVAADFSVRAISPDGRVVIGARLDGEYSTPERALIWDNVRGAREMSEALAEVGLEFDLTGWTLLTADAVSQSQEMYAVAGTGIDPEGVRAGWVATFRLPPCARRVGTHAGAGVADVVPATPHVDQRLLLEMVRSGDRAGARELAFEIGDRLFNTTLNEADGIGAGVGNGQRFTRVPRIDLDGPGQWATHTPARTTGPSAASCNACHSRPFDDGSGGAESIVVSDPLRLGRAELMVQRRTPHLFGAGAVQRLAEEMTDELGRIADGARAEARRSGRAVTRDLVAKGVSFGAVTAKAEEGAPLDTSRVSGIDPDLVVRPFGWKGRDSSLRAFSRDAAHKETGLQAVELVGAGVDGDFDGVVDELSVGDMTALAVYLAGQPRPTTRTELADLGLGEAVSTAQRQAIERGKHRFEAVGCAMCHVPTMTIVDPVFAEPSADPRFRDRVLPAGQEPEREGLSAASPVLFDLTRDQRDNRTAINSPNPPETLGSLARDENGHGVVELFGDLKRHEMGAELADSIDEGGHGRSVFLTRNLWGAGSTAPYLHDGRATTLDAAIRAHGGEALGARRGFERLADHERGDVLAFLKNMVLYKRN